ncbi:response regulator [Clostridium gasigenes]|uniref:Stage 0 sporulation protein A homolog n=1 Tax=Clostridium gasigenes TaxID=94869 RepID=A0A7X0SG65_9CLOT|nr:response regulator [Clostridium gasigenes]MBB6715747.1 response regulator [Clostridium gasigenes]
MKKRILIVDDEKNIRIALKQCFKGENYKVEMVNDGKEAIEKLKNDRYELILMDYQMPNKNGLEVLEDIRKNNIETRVIIMTAYGTVDIAVDSMKLGAVDFISKPFTIAKVKDVVRESIKKDAIIIMGERDIGGSLNEARDAIRHGSLEAATQHLRDVLISDASNPATQNLLGVIEEKKNNGNLAQKYYRAALSLDATYAPADNNLRRTAMYSALSTGIDLG